MNCICVGCSKRSANGGPEWIFPSGFLRLRYIWNGFCGWRCEREWRAQQVPLPTRP